MRRITAVTMAFALLAWLSPRAQATSYTYTKIEDAPIGPYDWLSSPILNSTGALLYAARIRGADDRWDIIFSDGIVRFVAMTSFPGQFHLLTSVFSTLPTSITTDGYFAWTNGTEV